MFRQNLYEIVTHTSILAARDTGPSTFCLNLWSGGVYIGWFAVSPGEHFDFFLQTQAPRGIKFCLVKGSFPEIRFNLCEEIGVVTSTRFLAAWSVFYLIGMSVDVRGYESNYTEQLFVSHTVGLMQDTMVLSFYREPDSDPIWPIFWKG